MENIVRLWLLSSSILFVFTSLRKIPHNVDLNVYIGALGGSNFLESVIMKPRKPSEILYEVDLTRIQGDGNFSCPNCGVSISPEDETEDVYRILEAKVRGQTLEELKIQCNKCGSKIRVIGFLSLHKDVS